MQKGGQKNRRTDIHTYFHIGNHTGGQTDGRTPRQTLGRQADKTCRHLCLNTFERTTRLRDEYTDRRTSSQLSHPKQTLLFKYMQTGSRTDRRIQRQTDTKIQFFRTHTDTYKHMLTHPYAYTLRRARLTSLEDVGFYQPCV